MTSFGAEAAPTPKSVFLVSQSVPNIRSTSPE